MHVLHWISTSCSPATCCQQRQQRMINPMATPCGCNLSLFKPYPTRKHFSLPSNICLHKDLHAQLPADRVCGEISPEQSINQHVRCISLRFWGTGLQANITMKPPRCGRTVVDHLRTFDNLFWYVLIHYHLFRCKRNNILLTMQIYLNLLILSSDHIIFSNYHGCLETDQSDCLFIDWCQSFPWSVSFINI